MMPPLSALTPVQSYVGTIVGESTSREFRLAVAHETIREQDIIAVDVELHRASDGLPERLRVWAKVQRIERINPLFPAEAGHELAATRTDPFDTVLSLSREMVTAVCQVLGAESLAEGASGKLDHVRYPPKPASSAYTPGERDLTRVLLGNLSGQDARAIELGSLSSRPEVAVHVDGHAVVTRHLAILAMTGAGKSWTARRLVEELAKRDYPIVIFDPHGDYSGLAAVPEISHRVKRYYAQLPIFSEDGDTVAHIVDSLAWELTPTMKSLFEEVFAAAKQFIIRDTEEMSLRTEWLSNVIQDKNICKYGVHPDLFLVANLTEAVEMILRDDQTARSTNMDRLKEWGWGNAAKYGGNDRKTLEGIKKRVRNAAFKLRRMEQVSQEMAHTAHRLPDDRTELVNYGQISIISLAGYTDEFQAMIYSIIADEIFEARLRKTLRWPAVLLLEEAHTFAPAKSESTAEKRAIGITKQLAQEGRKFGVGLILVSQRPSRLDETTLSQCNSFIIMRMVNPADQQFVRRVVETMGEDEAKMLPDLSVGEAILSGQFVSFPVLARMAKPKSEGEHEEEDAFENLKRIKAGTLPGKKQ